MNVLDKQYTELLQTILEHGVEKQDRTGTGTLSVFGRQIRHDMKDGFPLLTTKKMPWKTIVTELLWFLRGDTNIKYLVDNNCHIWDGDCYSNYLNNCKFEHNEPDCMRPDIDFQYLSQEEFINKIKTDDEFAKKWGELGPIYGKQWRKWKGKEFPFGTGVDNKDTIYFDQIQNLINDLKTNPDSRRLMVNSWNVGKISEMVLPPCHYGFQVYTRELSLQERGFIANSNCYEVAQNIKMFTGIDEDHILHKQLNDINIPTRAISLMWNQRSVDTPLGLPFNIASYGLLLTILGKIVNMVPDQLIGNLGDTHIYLNQIEGSVEQITRTGHELPTIALSDEALFDISKFNYDEITIDELIKSFASTDFRLENYVHDDKIEFPLSN